MRWLDGLKRTAIGVKVKSSIIKWYATSIRQRVNDFRGWNIHFMKPNPLLEKQQQQLWCGVRKEKNRKPPSSSSSTPSSLSLIAPPSHKECFKCSSSSLWLSPVFLSLPTFLVLTSFNSIPFIYHFNQLIYYFYLFNYYFNVNFWGEKYWGN